MKNHRTSFLKKGILFLLIILLFPVAMYSTHIVGGSLTYVHNGGNSYTFTLKLYRDCSEDGTAQQTAAYNQNAPLTILLADGSTSGISLTLDSLPKTLVPENRDTCSDAPLHKPCVQEKIYRGTIDLPPTPGGYHVYHSLCCRNAIIKNIFVTPTSPGTGETFYVFIPGTAVWYENFNFLNGTSVDNGITAWSRTNGSPGATSSNVNTQVYNVTDNGSKSWLEDFPTNGQTSDNGATAWTRTVNGSPSAQTANNRFEMRGASGATPAWSSAVINVSSFVDGFNLSAVLGQANNAMEAMDSVFIYYSLNGGPEILFAANGKLAGNIAATTASTKALTGNTIQIIARAKFEANNTGTEIFYLDNISISPLITNTWTSEVIDISAHPSGVSLSANLTETSTLDVNDTIQVYYSLDGGPLTLFTTNGQYVDDFTSGTASANSIIGNTVQIFVKTKFDATTASTVTYTVDNILVSPGCSNNWIEDFDGIANDQQSDNGATGWSSTVGGANLSSVQNEHFEFRGANNATPTWTSSVINISSYTSANLSVVVSQNGNVLDATDSIFVSYSLDGAPQVLFTNGRLTGNISTTIASANGLVGSTLQIFVRAKYNNGGNQNTERWYIDDISVVNTTDPCRRNSNNNSPAFGQPPPLYLCNGKPGSYDHSATDADGDSLVYSLYTPYDDEAPTFADNLPTFTDVVWKNISYSASAPFGASSSFNINPATGVLTYTPIGTNDSAYVVGIKVSEYRNGVLIGEIVRDYQFWLVTCYEPAQADIDSTYNACGNSVNFKNFSTYSSNTKWFWNFGDPAVTNDTSIAYEPSWNYPTPGTYTVTLIINKGTGCADTSYATVSRGWINADFMVSSYSPCANTLLTFTDTVAQPSSSNNPVTNYCWDFGDGTTVCTALTRTVTHTYTNIGSSPVTYTVTEVIHGTFSCTDTSIRYVTVYPTPTSNVTAGVNDSIAICASTKTVSATGTSNVPIVWSSTGTGTFSPNDVSLPTTYSLSSADSASAEVLLILTATGQGGCSAIVVKDTLVITINPLPIALADTASSRSICSNDLIQPLGSSIAQNGAGLWTSTGTGTFNPNFDETATEYVLSGADALLSSLMLRLSVTGTGACGSVQAKDSLLISITQAPIASVGLNKFDTVCSNVPVSITGSASNGTGIWSTTGDGTFNTDNTVNNATEYVLGVNDVINQNVKLYLSVTGANGCASVTDVDSLMLNITPEPIASVGLNKFDTICSNIAAPIAGSASNGTGIWSTTGDGFFNADNTVNNATEYVLGVNDIINQNVKLYLSVTGANGCSSVTDVDSLMLNITPAPTASVGLNKFDTVCSNIAAPIAGSASNGTGIWSTTGDGSFNADNTVNNATEYVLGANDIINQNIKLYLSVTGANGCSSVTDVDSLMLNITPEPIASVSLNKFDTICSNIAAPIAGSASNGTGIWSTTGDGSFNADNTVNNATEYILGANDIINQNVKLYLSVTGANGCSSVTDVDSLMLTITPAPVASVGLNKFDTVCSNAPAPITGSASNGTGIWSTTGDGSFNADNTVNNATEYVLGVNDVINQNVKLYLSVTGTNGCASVTDIDSLMLTITPAPIASVGLNKFDTICSNAPPIAGSALNGTGIWSTTGDGSFNADNTVNNATEYVLGANDIINLNVKLYLTVTGNNGCASVTDVDSLMLTFTPAPIASVGLNKFDTVCSNAPTPIVGSASNGTGIWSTTGDGAFNADNTVNNATEYVLGANDIINQNVKLYLSVTGANGCASVTDVDSLMLTITPAPIASVGLNKFDTVCSNVPTPIVGSASNGTGIWSTTGDGAFNADNTVNNATEYVLGVNDIINQNVKLYLSVTGANGCASVTDIDSLMLNITPEPIASVGLNKFDTVCSNVPTPIAGLASNGTGVWSTTGDGAFNADNTVNNATEYVLGTTDIINQNVKLYLSVEGANGCTNVTAVDSLMLTITPAPIASIDMTSHDTSVCANVFNVPIRGSVTNATGGWSTYDGTGWFLPDTTMAATSYSMSIADTANGIVHIVINAYGVGACSSTTAKDTLTITTSPTPFVSTGATSNDTALCNNISQFELNGLIQGATGGIWTTSGTGAFSPNNTTLSPVLYNFSNADTALSYITITLTTTGNGSCNSVSDTLHVTINEAPHSLYAIANSNPICDNDVTLFNAAGASGIVPIQTFIWKFGDSSLNDTVSSATPPVQHTYSTYGIYNSSLTVVDANGCRDSSLTVPVTIHSLPVVSFVTTAQCYRDSVFFDASASSTPIVTTDAISVWKWKFGDGAIKTTGVDNTAHTYPAPGFYTATLTATTNFGCVDSLPLTLTVTPSPHASFASDSVCLNNITTFTEQSYTDPGSGTNILNWHFEYGDGSSGTTLTHLYPTEGATTASLIVNADNGCSDTISKDVIIHPLPVANFGTNLFCVGQTALFVDSSTISSGYIEGWSWNFGNGTQSNNQFPENIYTVQGAYAASLTVTSDFGCENTLAKLVTVNTAPIAAFSTDKNIVELHKTINFIDQSSGAISWKWNFGDNVGSSTTPSPSYSYETNAGTYVTTLIVTNALGCTDTAKKEIIVTMPPKVPNAFTPNGSAPNNILYVMGGPYKKLEFRILNNWGEYIFVTYDQTYGWDGTKNGVEQPIGVYVYTLIATTEDDVEHVLHGDVTLLR